MSWRYPSCSVIHCVELSVLLTALTHLKELVVERDVCFIANLTLNSISCVAFP